MGPFWDTAPEVRASFMSGGWAVRCFVTRTGDRGRGVSRALAHAAVDFARIRGARALDRYPMIVHPGENITWGNLNVGSRSIFEAAGFAKVHRPTLRRVVMPIDFASRFPRYLARMTTRRVTRAPHR